MLLHVTKHFLVSKKRKINTKHWLIDWLLSVFGLNIYGENAIAYFWYWLNVAYKNGSTKRASDQFRMTIATAFVISIVFLSVSVKTDTIIVPFKFHVQKKSQVFDTKHHY